MGADPPAAFFQDIARCASLDGLSQVLGIIAHEQDTLLAISHTLAYTLELQPGLVLDHLQEIIEYTHGGLFALEDSTPVALAMRGAPHLEHSSCKARKHWPRYSKDNTPRLYKSKE